MLTSSEKQFLLTSARTAIAIAVDARSAVPVSTELSTEGSKRLQQNHPVFVTIYQHGELRGCIGCVRTDDSLTETVREMAIRAATGDPRFNPMNEQDLQDCTISISVLAPPKPVTRIDEIEVGRHGLIIDGLGRRGLLLPKVAVEQGWHSSQFVEQTCRKAGLPSGAWKQRAVRMYVFETVDFSESGMAAAGI